MMTNEIPDQSQLKIIEPSEIIVPRQQNLGTIIGASTIMLLVLVMIFNLSVYQSKFEGLSGNPITEISFWGGIGRILGVLGSVGVGGWFLRQVLRQRQSQPYLQDCLQQAVNYTRKIESILKTGSNLHEAQLSKQIETWWQTIETMAMALTTLAQNDDLIQRDLSQLPPIIVDLERQLSRETNSLLVADLQQMLAQRKNQYLALTELQTVRRRAEIQIERTIAVLGTIYSQLLTYRSTSHVIDYQQLTNNVAEEVLRLQDYLEALQEVKGSG